MTKCAFEKVLLPVDRSENSLRAIKFVGSLLSGLDRTAITLLYVMSGGYLGEHMKNIDFRAELIKETEVFKKIKSKHIEENIMPFLKEYEKILRDRGVKGEIARKIEEGDPGNKIIEIATKESFKTTMLARRGMPQLKGLVLGSVSNKVIHGLLNQNIYLVGQKISEQSPISKILLPVDDSEYSMKALEHAVCLAITVKGIKKITILRVINVSLYLERVRQGIDPEAEAEEILSRAKRRFTEEGLENIIEAKTKVGFPKDEIIKEVEEGGYDLIIMGRRGRSTLKDIVLGGVSSAVINSCLVSSIAIINN